MWSHRAAAETDRPPKSRATAYWLALGTTLAGTSLLASGLVIAPFAHAGPLATDTIVGLGVAAIAIGPSLGSLYAHQPWNSGLGMRLGGLAAFGIGGALELACSNARGDACDVGGRTFMALGAITYVVGSIYEIATSGRAVDRYNREHALAVTVLRGSDGTGAGLAIRGRF